MLEWIAKGWQRARLAARLAISVTVLTLASTLGVGPATSAAAPVSFTVPGGKVRILDMPRRDREIRNTVVLTVSEELAAHKTTPVANLDPARCPTGEVLITLEKQVTLQRKWAEVSTEHKRLGALLVRGTPCRIWLNARVLRRLDQARVCNIVRHELGHARGLDHSTAGLMAPVTPLLPVAGCEWAESSWFTDPS